MSSARALIVMGSVATAESAVGLVAVVIVLFAHGTHPPHVDADLLLGVVGFFLALAALGGSIDLLLLGRARAKERSLPARAEKPGGRRATSDPIDGAASRQAPA
jgi:hypothetical protein